MVVKFIMQFRIFKQQYLEMFKEKIHKKYRNYISPQFQSSVDFESNNTLHELIGVKPTSVYLNHLKNSSDYKVYMPLCLQKNQKVIQQQHLLVPFKVLTFNVWFEHNNEENRIPCLIQLMKDSDADFICLQEVTKDFMQQLQSSGLLRNYQTVAAQFRNWYETVILSKYSCRVIKKSFNQTTMGRSMLLAQTVLANGENIIVGSMHFESLDSQQIRKAQMTETFQACKHCPNVVIAGDFNFSDGYPQNELIAANGYRDLWLESIKQQKKEFSMSDSYTMPKTKRFSAWRPDHIIYKVPEKSQGMFASMSRVKKVGDFTIPPFEGHSANQILEDGIVRTPSDHLGLFSEIFFSLTPINPETLEKSEKKHGFFEKINIFKRL